MNNMVIFLPPLAWSHDTLKVICLQSCWLMELVSLKTDLDIDSVFLSCLCRSFSRNVVATAPHLRVCEQKKAVVPQTQAKALIETVSYWYRFFDFSWWKEVLVLPEVRLKPSENLCCLKKLYEAVLVFFSFFFRQQSKEIGAPATTQLHINKWLLMASLFLVIELWLNPGHI